MQLMLHYLELFLVTVAFSEQFTHGSRIARNFNTTADVPPQVSLGVENMTAFDSLKSHPKESVNKTNNITESQILPSNASSEPVPIEGHEKLLKTAFVSVESGQNTRNGDPLSLFTQRLSNSIFHIAPKDISSNNTNKAEEKLPALQTLIWSPFSVYQALLPVYYAANGETRQELGQLLLSQLQPNTKASDTDMSSFLSLSDLSEDTTTSSVKVFSSVTGLFAKKDVHLNPDFVKQVQNDLKTVEVKMVDFERPLEVTKSINMWVNDSTQGLINEAIDEAQVDPDMYMLIVNCVRFKASWQTRFNEKLTKVANFYGVSGVQRVSMMKQIGTQKFAKFPVLFTSDYEESASHSHRSDPAFSVLEMPYEGGDFVSLFILPETSDKLQETLDYVNRVGVAAIREMLHFWDVEVLMPKFKIKSDVNVEDALVENGIKTLFDPVKANLTNFLASHSQDQMNEIPTGSMKEQTFLVLPYLNNIIHRTIFETTEEGTTAAALTALSIVPLSALTYDRVYRFNLNRPFIVFLVKNDDTVVFQGVIGDLIGQDFRDSVTNGKHSIVEKESIGTPNKNSILYPSEGQIKTELDNLLNSNGKGEDNAKDLSRPEVIIPAKDNSSHSAEIHLPESNASEMSSEDRAWWIPKRIPVYLNPNTTKLNSSMEKVSVKDKNVEVSMPAVVKQTIPPAPMQIPPQLIQFTKYQQPEPKDPSGIRFPATIPLNRNQVVIKPRFENYDRVKNHLFRWMNVY